MADDDWTVDDDAQVRAALTSLRADVEAAPLPDVRFVKARGTARRRQRLLTWVAAAAAAAVVVGTVGYSQLGSHAPLRLDPARTTASARPTPSATTTSSLDVPGLLPLASEWQASLKMPVGAVTVTPVTKGGGVECGDGLGTPTRQESAVQASSPVSGAATYWPFDGQGDHKTQVDALEGGVATCKAGPGFTVTRELASDVSIYSYVTPDAGSGWFAVASGDAGVVLLQLVDPAFNDVRSGGFTKDQMAVLARVAAARLDRYSSSASTPSPSGGTTGGAKAIDEPMTVTGPGQVPSPKLFVAATQWGSEGLTAGATTDAGPGALEGSTAVAPCETDQQQAGIGGQVGVVSIRTGMATGTGTADASYIGTQRVQLDEATDPAVQRSYVNARVAEARALYGKGCVLPDGTVKSTQGPAGATYRLDTVSKDGSTTLSQWVGVTVQKTPGAVSTIVLSKVVDPTQGFAELDRLLALARQK